MFATELDSVEIKKICAESLDILHLIVATFFWVDLKRFNYEKSPATAKIYKTSFSVCRIVLVVNILYFDFI